MTNKPVAVLWDQDGTLIESEPYWIAAEFDLVREHGGQWSPEQAKSLVGNSLPTSAKVLQQAGVRLSQAEILDYLIERVTASVREAMPWRPGAHELLLALHEAGIPSTLVTASYRRLAEVVAQQTGGLIQVVVAGDDVTHGKPDPESYLRAAELLQVAAQDCVAIEDSPAGLQAALASGAKTIGVPCVMPIEPRPGLTVVDSLTEVDLNYLRRMFA